MSFMTCSSVTLSRAVVQAGVFALSLASLAVRPALAESPLPAIAAQAARPVLASTDGETAGMRLDITELRRTSGDTVTLRMTIVNQSNEQLLPQLFQTSLIDVIGKRKHFVARDSGGACVCSAVQFVGAGKSVNVWAKFSAPPGDVERVTVSVPGFMPAEDVPISR